MKKVLSVLMLLIVFLSCQEIERTPKPENLIPENKMVEVLTELSLLQGARSYNKILMEEKGINPYPYLMEKFSIDSTQFAQSNNYYADNYKQYNRIYGKVKERLEILMKKYDSIREVEEKIQDSIRSLQKNDSLPIPIPVQNDSLLEETFRKGMPRPVSINRKISEFKDSLN